MLHKLVEQGKTNAKCYILLVDITIGFGMTGAICGLEITMIKIIFSFCSNDKDKRLF